MGLGKGFGRTLRRLTGILYRLPKVMRRSGRLEVSLLWKSSGGSRSLWLFVVLSFRQMVVPDSLKVYGTIRTDINVISSINITDLFVLKNLITVVKRFFLLLFF